MYRQTLVNQRRYRFKSSLEDLIKTDADKAYTKLTKMFFSKKQEKPYNSLSLGHKLTRKDIAAQLLAKHYFAKDNSGHTHIRAVGKYLVKQIADSYDAGYMLENFQLLAQLDDFRSDSLDLLIQSALFPESLLCSWHLQNFTYLVSFRNHAFELLLERQSELEESHILVLLNTYIDGYSFTTTIKLEHEYFTGENINLLASKLPDFYHYAFNAKVLYYLSSELNSSNFYDKKKNLLDYIALAYKDLDDDQRNFLIGVMETAVGVTLEDERGTSNTAIASMATLAKIGRPTLSVELDDRGYDVSSRADNSLPEMQQGRLI